MTKELKKLMTEVAKGKLTMKEALEKINSKEKVAVRGSVKQNKQSVKRLDTHKRKKSIKLREVK